MSSVTGIEECCADLLRLKPALGAVAVTRGLHAAGAVIERAIDFKTPTRIKRVGGDAEYPSLITRLEVRVTMDSQFRGGTVEVGFWGHGATVAKWVEFGHRMVGHGQGKETRMKAWKDAGEAMVPAHPFMRPAADLSEEEAVDAFIGVVNEVMAEFVGAEAA